MTKLMMVVAVLALAGGCKKKSADEKPATPGSSQAMTPDDKMGSAMPGSGSGSGSATAAGSGGSGSGSAAPVAVTAESAQKLFDACWGYFNDAKWDDFKGCYAADAVREVPGAGGPPETGNQAITDGAKAFKAGLPDAKGETQFVMINGHTMLSAVLITGTNSAALKMAGMPEMPATNKKVGYYYSQVVELDDTGKVKHEWGFFDAATMIGQLAPNKDMPVRAALDKLMGPKEVAVAKDDAKEKANLETFAKLTDAFNKHDVKALGDLLDDKLMWAEVAEPKDATKAETLGTMPKMWKAFSDLKFTVTKSWAAGDYVAAVESFDGTNDGDGEHMKKTGKKVSLPFLAFHKFENGKNTMTRIIYQNLGFMTQLGMAPPAPPAAGAGSGSAPAKK